MTSTLEQAKRWVNMGIAVIPVKYKDKRPSVPWKIYQQRLPTLDELKSWFNHTPPTNVGVVCGWQGLTVLDFESIEAWDVWSSWARSEIIANDVAENTYTVMTGRGVHVYVLVEEEIRTKPMGFMDVKGKGGYVLAPPSVHPNGHIYTELNPEALIIKVGKAKDILPEAWLEVEEPSQPAQKARDVWDVANSAKEGAGVTVEEIKKRVRIEQMFPQTWPSGGVYLLARCPLHDDNRPSMWIDTERQICGCYAGCTSKPMDVINLFARMKGISNEESIREMGRW